MNTIEHRVQAPLHRVWDAWTKVAQLTAWDPDRIDGSIEAGQRIVMHWDSFGVSLDVDVIACNEKEELRLRMQRSDGSSQDLLVVMQGAGDSATDVSLSFEGAMSEDERLGTASGWHTQLRLLERYLALPPEPRESFSALGPAVVTMELAYEALAHPGRWLSQEDLHFQKEGQPYSITTMDSPGIESQRLSGEVLSLVEGRELALWCDELNGVVRLRAIPLAGGGARLLGVQVVRWGERPEALAIQESLRESVDRLVGLVGGPRGNA
jgi:uncharacterized protein YndB with AHSA1/START domain